MAELKPPFWIRLAPRVGGSCCGGSRGEVVTFTAAPFVRTMSRTTEGDPAFVERMHQRAAAWAGMVYMLMSLLILVAGIVGLAGSYIHTRPLQGVTVFMLLLGMFGVVLALWVFHISSGARRLVMNERDLTLAVQVVSSRGQLWAESLAPLQECRLSLHPVKLEAPKYPVSFSGWIARVKVRDRCFTLACCKTKEEVLQYMQALPAGLLAISTGDGGLVTGVLMDRHFNNEARVVKS